MSMWQLLCHCRQHASSESLTLGHSHAQLAHLRQTHHVLHHDTTIAVPASSCKSQVIISLSMLVWLCLESLSQKAGNQSHAQTV